MQSESRRPDRPDPRRINPTWQSPVSRPARPWSSVILPGTVKEDLLRDVQKFLSEKEMSWYAARGEAGTNQVMAKHSLTPGIPHRRGYLFAGEPGSGKTTLSKQQQEKGVMERAASTVDLQPRPSRASSASTST
jgi:hypothetical protein